MHEFRGRVGVRLNVYTCILGALLFSLSVVTCAASVTLRGEEGGEKEGEVVCTDVHV